MFHVRYYFVYELKLVISLIFFVKLSVEMKTWSALLSKQTGSVSADLPPCSQWLNSGEYTWQRTATWQRWFSDVCRLRIWENLLDTARRKETVWNIRMLMRVPGILRPILKSSILISPQVVCVPNPICIPRLAKLCVWFFVLPLGLPQPFPNGDIWCTDFRITHMTHSQVRGVMASINRE